MVTPLDKSSLKKPHLHFVGIGGIGMSGIAEVFFHQGFPVSGSDASSSETTQRLMSLGIRVDSDHSPKNVKMADVVIISSAIKESNPEVIEAKKQRIPVIARAEMLGELMRGKTGIALAGTHGKTTTTSLMATVMSHAGLDPTLVIGGKVDALGGNAKFGKGDYVVAEADESDGSFLFLPATYAVITNIDNDHMDHYGSMDALDRAFVDFVSHIPFYGKVAVCGDDPGVKRILPRLTKPYVTYGSTPDNDFYFDSLETGEHGQTFSAFSKESGLLGKVQLNVFGKHNALNALSVIGIGKSLGLSFKTIAEGLAEFKGVKRRFEIRHDDPKRKIRILDDYGHHPTEIEATLLAAKSLWKKGRIRIVFQPHRYTRTLHCEAGFLGCFKDSDELILTEIYSAGEDPIPGVSGQALLGKIQDSGRGPKTVTFGGTLENAAKIIRDTLQDGDLILCMGAGSITKLPDLLIKEIR